MPGLLVTWLGVAVGICLCSESGGLFVFFPQRSIHFQNFLSPVYGYSTGLQVSWVWVVVGGGGTSNKWAGTVGGGVQVTVVILKVVQMGRDV